MTRNLTFYKTEEGRWYVSLPEWEGDMWELEMVEGADIMLDIYSQFENSVTLKMSDEKFEGSDELVKLLGSDDEPGMRYSVTSLHGVPFDFTIWLCDVTKFVFGYFPESIYVKC